MAAQHGGVTPERWKSFDLSSQILMMANELNRGRKRLESRDPGGAHLCYERILHLVDLTVAMQSRRPLRRELLRWRDLIASLYLADDPALEDHLRILRVLLRFTGRSSEQIPLILPPRT